MLRGQRKMTNEEAHQIASTLGLPITEVLRQAGIKVVDDVRKVSITGYVDAGGTVRLFPTRTHESIVGPADCPAGTYALQIRNPGGINDGFLLFVSPAEAEPSTMLDHLCTVALESGEQVVAGVRRGYRQGTYNLQLVPSTEIRNDCKAVWAAPILWVKPL